MRARRRTNGDSDRRDGQEGGGRRRESDKHRLPHHRRTDARSSLGIDEAIARGQAYAAAGADVVFVESPESEDEFARVVAEIDAPVLANMVEGGFSPVLSADRLAELGVTIGLFPVTALLAVTAQLQAVYGRLRADGIGPTPGADMRSISDLHGLMGLDEVQQFEERWND